MTVIQAPAELSDPDGGDTVTLPFGLLIRKLTGPPTAVRMNVPLAGWPLTAVSTSPFGDTLSVPGVGEGDGDGEGDGEGEGDRDGGSEDLVGAGDLDVPGDVLWPAVGTSAGDIDAFDAPAAGVGSRLGEDGPG